VPAIFVQKLWSDAGRARSIFLVVEIPQGGEGDDASQKQDNPEGTVFVARILHYFPLEI
jgi:hypothetical protein